jgi:hypothetical protein
VRQATRCRWRLSAPTSGRSAADSLSAGRLPLLSLPLPASHPHETITAPGTSPARLPPFCSLVSAAACTVSGMTGEQWVLVVLCGVVAGAALERAGVRPWVATLSASAAFGALTWLMLTLQA